VTTVLRALAQESGSRGCDRLALEGNDSEEASGNATLAEDMQSRRIGINGVPFFVFNGRFGLSGAQEPEALINMFDLAHEDDLAKGAA
jgi:predicted DsbA family dithiol-disulfide isomerase